MPTILVVEDTEMIRDLLVRRLQRQGFNVIAAADGAEGLSRVQAERPDIILMDMNLPVLDGWEATRRLKAEPQTQAIPVIALTASGLESELEKARAAGCNDYDIKPIEFTRLLTKIQSFLT
jgi:CheY-like chemotaxis protein